LEKSNSFGVPIDSCLFEDGFWYVNRLRIPEATLARDGLMSSSYAVAVVVHRFMTLESLDDGVSMNPRQTRLGG
jgi:hypothetical protein